MKNDTRRLLMIYNPISGRGGLVGRRRALVGRVVRWFGQRGWTVVPHALSPLAVGKADEIIPPVLPEPDPAVYRAVIAAGGDGTLHWTANTLLWSGAGLPLAVLPWGTSNDFAANLDIRPHHPLEKLLDNMHTALVHESHLDIDVGEAGGRYFVNLLGFGLLTNVAYEVAPRYKNTLGRLAYILNAVPNLKSYRPFQVRFSTPDGERSEELLMMLIQNGIGAGGFKKVAPRALCNDGMFDVVGFRTVSWLKMWSLVRQVLRGEHLGDPAVVYLQTPGFEVGADRPLTTTMDGERGPRLPLTVTVHPRRLRLLSLPPPIDDSER
ncbi:MAG: diacylglycerol kinase family protein [Bacillota bacterium]